MNTLLFKSKYSENTCIITTIIIDIINTITNFIFNNNKYINL